jgi:hypothetical protein
VKPGLHDRINLHVAFLPQAEDGFQRRMHNQPKKPASAS